MEKKDIDSEKPIEPLSTEIIHKEIDLIQSVITRMANNSFLLKGWVITIIVAVLALKNDTIVTGKSQFIPLMLLLPLLTFWYLDAFYLHKERCFRELYKWVVNNRKYSSDHLYSLDYSRVEKEVDGICKIMRSSTLSTFYGMALIIPVSYTHLTLPTNREV